MNVTQAGIVNPVGTKASIIKDLIQHAMSHYEDYDEKKLMTRLNNMDEQEIEDLANYQGAFHHFFVTTNSQPKRNLYGLGEHGSDMKSDYKITIEKNTNFDLNIMRQIISRLINESVGRAHIFDLMPTEIYLPMIHATSQFPSTAKEARKYYQRDGQSFKIRVGSILNFERLLNHDNTYCRTGFINLNNVANEQYTLKGERLIKKAEVCQFVILGSHSEESTNITATEI